MGRRVANLWLCMSAVLIVSASANASLPPHLAPDDARARLADYLFPASDASAHGNSGRRTDGIYILQNGQVIYERYARGFSREQKHVAWSMSKSVLVTLVGIAVKRGLLSEDDSICRYGLNRHCELTLRHLLHWSSCLSFRESYDVSKSPASSNVLQMLYMRGRKDMSSYVLSHSLECDPGSRWRYSSGDSNVVARVLQNAVGHEASVFPWTALFDRLGIHSATWERDESGSLVGSSYLSISPEDLAKIGVLYLNRGRWKSPGRAEDQLLDPQWIDQALSVAPSLRIPSAKLDDGVSGEHWWINRELPHSQGTRPWPGAPADAFAALGHRSQVMLVIPSQNLVAVRFGDTHDGSFQVAAFAKFVSDLGITASAARTKTQANVLFNGAN